jgi:hypothetical protein
MTIALGFITNAQLVGSLMTALTSPQAGQDQFQTLAGGDGPNSQPRLAYTEDVMSELGNADVEPILARAETVEAPPESKASNKPVTEANPVMAPAPAEPAIELQIETLRTELSAQRALIEAQAKLIAAQQTQLQQLTLASTTPGGAPTIIPMTGDLTLSEERGAGMGHLSTSGLLITAQAPSHAGGGGNPPAQPVGEAPPPEPGVQTRIEALPEGQGVLTPRGKFVLDTSYEYTNSSNNRLVFRGFELIPGLQVGLIEASDVDRDTIVGSIAGRYGITNRLEVEARMSALYRSDRIEVTQQRDEGIVRTVKLNEYNIGDAEVAVRYQLNAPKKPNHAIWIASLRVKSDTGKSPFEVGYDDFGVATGLATGSGFWAAQPGISFLLPSDPVVIYGGASYLYHIPRDIDRLVGNAFIGRVDPGDAINANIGFGFALNQRFSFSLGYRHSYLFPSKTEIGTTLQKSNHLQVGSLGFGMSYRLSQRQSVNFGVELGATADAPNVSMVLRLPLSF